MMLAMNTGKGSRPKIRDVLIAKHGSDYFSRIGRLGGQVIYDGKGFDSETARIAGRKGGLAKLGKKHKR